MARKRDVQLLLSARNNASSAIRSVVNDLQKLQEGTRDVGQTSRQSQNAIDNLGRQFNALNGEVAALRGLGTAVNEIDNAGRALNRLGNEVEEAVSDLDRLSTEYAEVARATRELQGASQAGNTAIAAATARLKELKAEARQSRADITALNATFRATNAATKAAGQSTLEQVAAQRANREALAQAQATRDRANAGIQAQRQLLENLRASQARVNDQLDASERAQRTLGEATNRTAIQAQRAQASFEAEAEALRDIREQADAAARALGLQAASQAEVAAATERANRLLRRAAIEQAPTVSVRAEGQNTGALRQQLDGVRLLERELRIAQQELAGLSRELRSTANPTRELQVAQQAAAQTVARLTSELAEQRANYAQLKTSVESVISPFARASQNFSQITQAANAQRAAIQGLAAPTQQSGNAIANLANRFRGFIASIGQLNNSAQQSTSILNRLAQSAQRSAQSTQQLGDATQQAGQRFTLFNNNARQSLSLTQRIRGQVLSLTASYVGLFQAFQQAGGAVQAFQTLEAAQNRLGAVFDQDLARVGSELDFLRRNSERLGIEFGVLSNQYSRFAVAANAANFSSQATREIFLAVTEAGRVNKLSLDALNGTFVALEQTISKGTVQSEELRRQLGDRLPGAFNIFAAALGISTEELNKQLQAGQVLANQDTLLRFAAELNRRFGPQLESSLQSTTTEIGRFQNSLFNARLQFGQGGFIDAFTDSLRRLNEFFASREGRDFFLGLGAAAGQAVEVFSLLGENIDIVTQALALFAASRVFNFFQRIIPLITQKTAQLALLGAGFVRAGQQARTFAAGETLLSFSRLRGTLATLPGAVANIGRSFTTVSGTVGTLSAAGRGLAGVFGGIVTVGRTLLGVLGGIPGIIASIVLFAPQFLSLSSGIDTTTRALDEQQRILDEVATAYEAATDKSNDFLKSVRNVSRADVVRNLEDLSDAVLAARRDFAEQSQQLLGDNVVAFDQGQIEQIRELNRQFEASEISVDDFIQKLSDLRVASDDPAVQGLARSLEDAARAIAPAERGLAKTIVIAKEYGIETRNVSIATDLAEQSIGNLVNTANALETALNPETVSAFGEAFDTLRGSILSTKQALEFDNELRNINDAFRTIASTPGVDETQLLEAQRLAAQGTREIIRQTAEQAVTDDIINRVVFAESGGRSSAANPRSSARGQFQFIESTFLEFFERVFPAQAQSLSREQILAQRGNADIEFQVGREFLINNAEILIREIGPEAVTARNLKLAQFGGERAAQILQADPNAQLGQFFSTSESAANPGLLDQNRTVGQLLEQLERKVNVSRADVELQKESVRLAEEQAQKESEFLQNFDQRFAARSRENEALAESNREFAIQRAIEQEVERARRAGVTLDQERLNIIREITGERFDEKAREDAITAAKQQQQDLLETIVGLERQRQTLRQEFVQAFNQGDTTNLENIQQQFNDINARLPELIAQAREFAAALGDERAIAVLDRVEKDLQGVRQELNFGQVIAQQFAQGGANAFDQFAQAIANGESVFNSLREAFLRFASDFLRQIAQIIIQQTLLNALGGPSNNFGFAGGIGGFIQGLLFHDGGVVGQGGTPRAANPAWFRNAPRFHEGGVAGLRSDEVPAILQRGEEVLTRSDPRNVMNGGGAGGANIKVVNTIDAGSFVSEGLSSSMGEKAILNFIRSNSSAVRAAMGT